MATLFSIYGAGPTVIAQIKGKPGTRTTTAAKPVITTTADTSRQAGDSITVSGAPKGDIETTIKYSARDSIRFEVSTKIVHLYGDAKINYGTMSLKAAYIQINWQTNILSANGVPDSTGKDIGTPVFEDGPEKYTATKLAYNFKTKRGKISGAVTQQGEGFIHAQTVKKNADNTIFAKNARYTTCNLEHPHFYINAGKMKMIPNDKVVSGPFNLVVADIPTPLGFVLGLFPSPDKRASGIIIPSYGETRERGFFLKDGGYYLALNDYVGIKLLGDIYSLGGYAASTDINYRKRYSYNGNFNFRYDVYQKPDEADLGISTDPSRIIRPPKSFWVRWQHDPVTRPGKGQFSTSVNAGTNGSQRLTSQNTQNLLSNNFNSSIRYSRVVPNSPFNYTATLRLDQNAGPNDTIGTYTFTLPDVTVGMTPQNVYKLFANVPTGKWYEQITVGYNFDFKNRITNRIEERQISGVPFLVGGTDESQLLRLTSTNYDRILDNSQIAVQHRIPINLSSFKIFKYFTLNPNINYDENWYFKKLNYSYDEAAEAVRVDTIHGFNRTYSYSGNASLTTRIYGTRVIKGKKVEAIRHTVVPTLLYSYAPDLRDAFLQNLRINPAGEIRQISPYNNFLNAPSFTELQSRIGFRLDNSIEMKVRSAADSAAGGFKKVPIIDQLTVNASYNLAADSFNMSPIGLSLSNNNLFQIFTVLLTAEINPYQVDSEGALIDEFEFSKSGFQIGRLTNANLNIGADLNPDNWGKIRKPRVETVPTNLASLEQDLYMSEYVDFNIPWTLQLQFTSAYTKLAPEPAIVAHSLTFNGSVNLTEKWKIGYTSGYDFTNKDITHTNLNITRDLHCWEMRVNWIPFGFYQSYSVTINAKASMLQDLRINRNRSWQNR